MSRPGDYGFTLLEILIVLVLIGMMMGLVGPGVVGQIDRSQERDAIDRFQSELSQLPRWARITGKPLALENLSVPVIEDGELLLDLPPGWRAQFSPKLIVSPRQLCNGSNVSLFSSGGTLVRTFSVQSPDCSLQRTDT
ncbi:prepilin-type N-terminal cleavage/methylation domain-containing protein [Chitinimonas sp. BJYL2]|uniref:prepilin-type N-terminal cleavage/methylation domain-containing protein n=1 Tax=Chitinimonas sp. BJYL2 TaxID=2976696 RepID=UPI0022B3FDD0